MRNLWLVLLFVFSLATSSCLHTGPPPLDGGSIETGGRVTYWEEADFPLWLLIDKDMSANHKFGVMTAALKWNAKVGETVFEPVVYDFSRAAPRTHGYVVVSIKQLGESSSGRAILGMCKNAYHEDTSHVKVSQVWYDIDDPSKDAYVNIMVHELGHALTLDHDPGDERSIMYPRVHSGTMYIMPDDIDRVRTMVTGEYDPSDPVKVDERIKILP